MYIAKRPSILAYAPCLASEVIDPISPYFQVILNGLQMQILSPSPENIIYTRQTREQNVYTRETAYSATCNRDINVMKEVEVYIQEANG